MESQILQRARRLRANAKYIPASSFLRRRYYFNNPETGLFRDRGSPNASAQLNSLANNPMMDPNNMSEMMKKSMTMIIPQIVLMSWVSHFFSGFVLGELFFCLVSISI